MTIDHPDFLPAATALVRRDRTSVPDVWRHYDLAKADRVEPAAVTLPIPIIR